MKQRYLVILPVEIDGRIYNFHEFVNLEPERAKGYAHALVEVADVEKASE